MDEWTLLLTVGDAQANVCSGAEVSDDTEGGDSRVTVTALAAPLVEVGRGLRGADMAFIHLDMNSCVSVRLSSERLQSEDLAPPCNI